MSKATNRDERMKERENKKAKVDEHDYDSDDVRFLEGMFNIFIIQLKYAQFSFGCIIRSGHCYTKRRGR